MRYEWDNVGEEFWTTNCAWCLGIDLIHHQREQVGKVKLFCRPKKVLYDLPDVEIECTVYKYSSKENNIDEIYAAVGKFKNYWVVFNDKLSFNKALENINMKGEFYDE